MGILSGLLKLFRGEARASTLTWDEAYYGKTFGVASKSGVSVNSAVAFKTSAWNRAMSLLSKDVAKLPLFVYRRLPGGGKDRAVNHPAYRILRHKAGPFISAYEFRKLLQFWALSFGNGYAEIRYNGRREPSELVPLHPNDVTPMINKDTGNLFYWVDPERRTIAARDMIHIRGMSDDGIVGLSVIDAAREALGLSVAQENYGAKFFANAGIPSVVLEVPGNLNPEAKKLLIENWQSTQAGMANHHKAGVITSGMKLHQLDTSPESAQFIASRQFQVKEIALFVGVPPHKLGDDTRISYNSLEQENQSYLNESLDPWLVHWEGELLDKLFTETQKHSDSHFVEFRRQALLRADAAARGEFYTKMLQQGVYNRDEIRSFENENPIEDGSGAIYMVPLNMGIIEDGKIVSMNEPEPPPPAPEPPPTDPEEPEPPTPANRAIDAAKATRAALAEAIKRAGRKMSVKAVTAAKEPEGWTDFCHDGIGGERSQFMKDCESPVRAYAAVHNLDMTDIDAWDGFRKIYTQALWEAAEVPEEAFRDSVQKACDAVEATLSMKIMEGLNNGT